MYREFAGSDDEYRAWLRTIRETHQRRLVVRVMTLEHDAVAALTPLFVTGNVTIDVTRDTRRVLSLQLLDPTRSIRFEPDDGEMPLYLNRMIRVTDQAWVPSAGKWLGPHVHTGPVVDFDRDGALVTVTAHSKDALGLRNFGTNRTWGKKTKVTDVIKALLRAMGETRLGQIPDLKATLGEKLTVTRLDQPVLVARRLARGINRELEWDGAGIPQLFRKPSTPRLTVPITCIASDVRIDRNPEGLRNRWIVLGANPKGPKKRAHADIKLPRNHKASAHELGPGDSEGWLIEQEENSKFKTNKRCHERAREMRDATVAQVAEKSVEILPHPHLEEWDMVAVVAPDGRHRIQVRQSTLSLGLDGQAQSLGVLQRTRVAGRPKGKRGGKGGKSNGGKGGK